MQKYVYKAMKPDGKSVRGKLIANSPDELKSMVSKNGLYLVSFEVDKTSEKAKKRMDYKTLITMCNQLSSMLKAGLSIANSLEMLYTRTEEKSAKKALGTMYESVQKGNALSDTVIEMGSTFPSIMASMIKAGELSGELDKTMANLAEHFESDQKLNNQIKSATSYPIMILGICLVVVVLMVGFVLPKMAGSLGENMPALTKFLLQAGDWVKQPKSLMLIGAIVVVLIVAIPLLKANPKVRFGWDKLKLNLPKFGKLVKMIYTSRFARGLATLYDNGIELITAMEMSKQLVGNVYVESLMDSAIEKIKKGEPISVAMASINCFDVLLTQMIYVGEESGVLGEVLGQTSDYFDEESQFAIKKIVGMINPIMMIFMAGIVGVVMMAVMMPIFSMYSMDSTEAIVKIINTIKNPKL